jgi:hypothetical protein
MKTIKVFETIDELIHCFEPARNIDDDFPLVPYDIELRHQENGLLYFFGDGADEYDIKDLYLKDLIKAVMLLQKIHYVE